MSTTNKNTIKSAAGSGKSTMGAVYNKTTFKYGFKVLSVKPGDRKPIASASKQLKSNKKYIDSPTRNANLVSKKRDVDIKVARDLKFEFQGIFPDMTGLHNVIKNIGDVDMSKVNSALGVLARIDPNVINNAVSGIGSSADSIGTFFSFLKDRFDIVASKFENKTDLVFYSSCIAIASLSLSTAIDPTKDYSMPLLVACIAAIATAPDTLSTRVMSLVTSVYETAFGVQPQSFSIPVESIAHIMAIALGVATMPSGEKHYFKFLNEFFASFDRKASGIKTIFEFIFNGCVKALNYCLQTFGFDKIYAFNDTGTERSNSFMSRYNDMVKLIDEKKFPPTEENFRTLVSLCDCAQDILSTTSKHKENANICQLISNIYTKLLLKKEQFLASNFNLSGVRVEPVCIVLKGAPGVGKSQTVLFLQAAICAFALKGEELIRAKADPTKFMFNRQAENVYWDGYDTSHIVTVFDDFGQIRDVAGNPDCEYMNLIRAVNEFPAMLHTAAMEKKAHSFFRSEFVIMTTNKTSFRPESIECTDALTRRFHLCYEVHVKDEFATNGQIDPLKLRRDERGMPICDPGVVSFVPYDFKSGSYIGEPIDFYDLVRAVRDRWILHKYRTGQKMGNLDDVMDKVSAEFQMRFSMPRIATHLWLYAKNLNILNSLQRHVAMNDDDVMAMEVEGYESDGDPPIIGHPRFGVFMNEFTQLFMDNKPRFAELLHVEEAALSFVFVERMMLLNDMPDWKRPFVSSPDRFFRTCHARKVEGNFLSWTIMTPELLAMGNALFGSIHRFMNVGFSILKAYCFELGALLAVTTFTTIFTRSWRSKKGKMLQHIGSPFLPEFMQPQSSYATKTPKIHHKQVDFKAIQNAMKAENQSFFVADRNGSQIAKKIIARNLYRIKMFMGESVQPVGFALFVRGTTVMVPQHFVFAAAAFISRDEDFKNYPVTFELAMQGATHESQSYTITFKQFVASAEVDNFDGRDVAMIKLPRSVPMHQDIVEYFLSDKDFARIKDWHIRLVIAHEEQHENMTGVAMPIVEPIHVGGDDFVAERYLTKGFMYAANTTKGDCGSPLFVINSKLPKARLIGIHVAGMPQVSTGFCSAVSREELEIFFTSFPDDIEEFESEEFDTFDMAENQGRFKGLYKAKLPHNSGVKTQIKRSLLYGYMGDVKTAPAILRPVWRTIDGERVCIDPYAKALMKYCHGRFNVDNDVVVRASLCVYEMLRKTSDDFEGQLFSFEEAVAGEEGNAFFGSLSRSTSAGYPYSAMKLGKGKFPFFGTNQDYEFDGKLCLQLREEVENIIHCASQGIRLEHIFTDNMKDERRAIEKIESVSTRLFSGAPLAYTIAFRMYFGKFISWYISNNVKNGSAIGLNVFGYDWNMLANAMLSKANKEERAFGAGDYSGFDGSEKPHIHWSILDLINSFYDDGEENQKIRRVLWYEVVNSKHIRGNGVYCWPSSLPSGHPATTIINNLYNHIAFNVCWILVGNPVFGSGSFYNNVYLCAMGDDNIYAVNNVYRDTFTEPIVSEKMALMGLKYTPESDKNAKFAAGLRKFVDISFLKRKFRWDNFTSRWVAPIELDVICDMPNWTKINPELSLSITTDNVENALMELSLHGKEVYDQYAKIMIPAYRRTRLRNLQYEDYYANVEATHNRLNFL